MRDAFGTDEGAFLPPFHNTGLAKEFFLDLLHLNKDDRCIFAVKLSTLVGQLAMWTICKRLDSSFLVLQKYIFLILSYCVICFIFVDYKYTFGFTRVPR